MVCKELERYVPRGILREVVGCKNDAMLFLSCVQIITAVLQIITAVLLMLFSVTQSNRKVTVNTRVYLITAVINR